MFRFAKGDVVKLRGRGAKAKFLIVDRDRETTNSPNRYLLERNHSHSGQWIATRNWYDETDIQPLKK